MKTKKANWNDVNNDFIVRVYVRCVCALFALRWAKGKNCKQYAIKYEKKKFDNNNNKQEKRKKN